MNLNVNIVGNKMDTTSATNSSDQSSTQEPQGENVTPNRVRLVDVEVGNANEAFNLMIQFLSLAQSRGAFKIDESAKIYDCLKMFNRSDASKDSS